MTAKGNAVLVEALGSSLRYGGSALEDVPALFKRLMAEEAWREFVTPRGKVVHHERFASFLATPPTEGIGASVELFRRIIADDPEALDLFDRAMQNPAGVNLSRSDSDVITIPDSAGGRGTSKDYALRKLRKDAPELHAEVLAGNLSAHAAMVKAGFRRKTRTIRLDDADSAAKTIRKHMPLEARQRLARLLLEE